MPDHLGFGLGLRHEHLQDVLDERVSLDGVDWFEIITEEVLDPGGMWIDALEKIRADRPIGLHGLCLGVGNAARHSDYVTRWLELVTRIQPALVSDHLCWSAFNGTYAYDLLPLPYSADAVELVVDNIRRLQDDLQRRLIIENTSAYVSLPEHEMTELEFVNAVLDKADCELLLDVNNVVVNAYNLGFSAGEYIDGLDAARVKQIHLAGHTDRGSFLYDTHIGPIPDEVWALYRRALGRTGPVPTLIEWDSLVPAFEVLTAEVHKARTVASEVAPLRPELRRSRTQAGTSPTLDVPPSVRTFQRRFWSAMRGDDSVLPPSAGLEAYRQLFHGRRLDQLVLDFGAFGSVIAEDDFFGLVERFIELGMGRLERPRSLSDDFLDFVVEQPLEPFAIGVARLDHARSQLLVEPESTSYGPVRVAAHRFVRLPDVTVLMWRQGYEVLDRATSEDERAALGVCIENQEVPSAPWGTQWEAEGLLQESG